MNRPVRLGQNGVAEGIITLEISIIYNYIILLAILVNYKLNTFRFTILEGRQ